MSGGNTRLPRLTLTKAPASPTKRPRVESDPQDEIMEEQRRPTSSEIWAQLQQMQQQLAVHAEQARVVQAENEQLKSQIQELITPEPTPAATPGGPSTETPTTNELAALLQAVMQNLQPREPTRRMVVSDPEPFEGSDAKLYPPWEQAIGAKFRTDGWAYINETARVDYMYNRLKGKAQIQAEQ